MTAPLSLGTPDPRSLYERIGPAALEHLVDHFYNLVAQHPDLSPIFPDDLDLTKQKQLAFLSGFLGGPPLYHQQFGNPRLRARHLPFEITPTRAQAWLLCMEKALKQTTSIDQQDAQEMLYALHRVATHMVNTPDDR